jgi:hypothetical protein
VKGKLALMVVSAVLVCSIAANAYFYTQAQHDLALTDDLKKQAAELQSELETVDDEKDSLLSQKAVLLVSTSSQQKRAADLRNQTASLEAENSRLRSENAAIQAQIDQVSQNGTPRIVTRLGAKDVRESPAPGHPWSEIIRFYVSGEVWNVGTGAARNCRLHVTIYQGDTVANDTYLELGTINAWAYADVAANIYYAGEALTNWTIIPECG